jgi:hypothetical protein
MADVLQPYHQKLTDRALAEVYQYFVTAFAQHEIPATFAYVMAFTLTPAEREIMRSWLTPREGVADNWMSHFWSAQARGDHEGWFQPAALEIVRQDPRHEIACHSFCHRPLGDAAISEAEARDELAAAEEVARLKQLSLKTFIYPRNNVGHVKVLTEKGYIGYREVLHRPGGTLGQAVRLTAEFNVLTRPQAATRPREDGLVPIPPGHFFNWKFGPRRRVPSSVTIARWKHMIDSARDGQVVHLWLHPHNMITAPQTKVAFEAVLAHAARRRDSGQLQIVTQQHYSEQMTQPTAERDR